MLKLVADEIWFFDAEWVPDPATGRRIYSLPDTITDDDAIEHMRQAAGATADNPNPYLKTVMCQIVSVAAVVRTTKNGKVSSQITSLPRLGDGPMEESLLLGRFLGGLGDAQPQLVGFASVASDIPALVQRALVNRVQAAAFSKRPSKPWEGKDYFARGSDWHFDLLDIAGNRGKDTPKLHELAAACGLPGKTGVEGADVAELWRAGNMSTIVQYNITDAVTTYLVWLRLAHMGGHVAAEQMRAEETQIRSLVEAMQKEHSAAHLARFLAAWRT